MIRCPRRLLAVVAALLCAAAGARAQQPATIEGEVRGGGVLLSGATVSLPELRLGTYTGLDGRFRLVVPAGRYRDGQGVRLMVRLLGYDSAVASIALAAGRVVQAHFNLALDPLRLGEIVATGAGTSTLALRLGTMRAAVDSTLLGRLGQVNLLQALAGRVPGAITMQQGGEPGASTALRIRGAKTFGGSGQPLLVVDGVPLNNETRATGVSALQGAASMNRGVDLNPDDIESIEVLKGPAAAGIYGSSAGVGGVLLITTRRGRAGPAAFAYHTSLTLDRPARYLPLQRVWGLGTGGAPLSCSTSDCLLQGSPGSWGPRLVQGAPTFDHARELYTTGRMLDNTLSVSGGDDRSTFYVSLGATAHNGFIVGDNDQYRRYSVRLNATRQLSSALSIGGSAAYVQTSARYVLRGNTINGIVLDALRTPPDFNNLPYLDPVSGAHRSYRFPNPSATGLTKTRGFDNPFYSLNEDRSTSSVGRILGNLNATWSARPWLSVAYTLGLDQANDDRLQALAISSSSSQPGGSVEVEQLADRIVDHTLTVMAARRLGPGLDGSLTVGQNLRQTTFHVLDVTGTSLMAPQPFNLGNTANRGTPFDRSTRIRLAGYLLQGTLGVSQELFLSAGVRNDAASTFAPGNQSAWYPRASAAWSFARRLGLPARLLSFGKLRLAFGQSGQLPQPYQLQDIYNDATIPFQDGDQKEYPSIGGLGGLYTSSNRANPRLHPERNSEIETGADLSFLDGRVEASLTYYLQDARGVIVSLPLAPSSGATTTPANAARITNKGFESSLNLRLVNGRTIGLEAGLSWALNRNHVVSLGDTNIVSVQFGDGVLVSSSAQVGYPMGILRGTDFARCGRGLNLVGVNDVGTACRGAPDGALYIGSDGFPIADGTQRVIGDPNPDWTGGLALDLRLRGIHLNAFVEHRRGGVVYDGTRASLRTFGTHADTQIRGQQRTFGVDYLPGPAVGPGTGRAVTVDEQWFTKLGGLSGPQAQFLEDATFTRLRELSLSGTVRSPRLRAAGLASVDLRIAAQNLVTWTRYAGFDPEPSLGGAVVPSRGIDYFGNPLARGVQLSLTLHP